MKSLINFVQECYWCQKSTIETQKIPFKRWWFCSKNCEDQCHNVYQDAIEEILKECQ